MGKRYSKLPTADHRRRKSENPWSQGTNQEQSSLNDFYDNFVNKGKDTNKNTRYEAPEVPQNEAYERYLAQMQQGVQNAPYTSSNEKKNHWTHLHKPQWKQEKPKPLRQSNCCCGGESSPTYDSYLDIDVNKHSGVGLVYNHHPYPKQKDWFRDIWGKKTNPTSVLDTQQQTYPKQEGSIIFASKEAEEDVIKACKASSKFKSIFERLKSSEETYEFRRFKAGASSNMSGNFHYDGNHLVIEYDVEESHNYGEGELSPLFHETEHARQFEDGEIGFTYNSVTKKWDPDMSYEIVDEYKAHQFGFEAPGSDKHTQVRLFKDFPTALKTFEKMAVLYKSKKPYEAALRAWKQYAKGSDQGLKHHRPPSIPNMPDPTIGQTKLKTSTNYFRYSK